MLYYFGIANLPGKMAHSIQEMQMCEAFVEAGEEVIYLHGHVLGEREKVMWDDVSKYYGLETRFTLKTFRNLYGKTGRFTKIGTLSMSVPMATYIFLEVLAGRIDHDDTIYGRNYYPLYFLTELLNLVPDERSPTVIFEFHDPIKKRFKQRFFDQVDGVVCITEKLAEYTVETYGVERNRILVAPDGVDLGPYEELTQQEAREKLGLPPNEDIVMYIGHLYEEKGVETLVRAAEGLDASVYIVGGYEEDIERVKRDAGHSENVVFTGFVEPAEIPAYQIAADVLVAPYEEDSREFISPLKLFEYMAAGRPIVASDRDVLQEVLVDEENALLFEMGNDDALLRVLERILDDEALAERLGHSAGEDIEQYTWNRRAKHVLSYF
jgi:glycosyltransferase involved in cell wall biosynthesis